VTVGAGLGAWVTVLVTVGAGLACTDVLALGVTLTGAEVVAFGSVLVLAVLLPPRADEAANEGEADEGSQGDQQPATDGMLRLRLRR
jgi:hypothetical protein